MKPIVLLISVLATAAQAAAPQPTVGAPGQLCQFKRGQLDPEPGQYLRIAYPAKAACEADWRSGCAPLAPTLNDLPQGVALLQAKQLSWVGPPVRFDPLLAQYILTSPPGAKACLTIPAPSIGLYRPDAQPGKDEAVEGFYSQATCQQYLASARTWLSSHFARFDSFKGYRCLPLQEPNQGARRDR